MNWAKAWSICEKYCLINKVEEVAFKMLHGIYMHLMCVTEI